MPPPILRTARLVLRPFTLDDGPAVQELAGAYDVARNTLVIPHPYPEGAAEEWISRHETQFAERRVHHFAIDDGRLAGAIALTLKRESIAEIGYWIGMPFWGRGYAPEAAEAVVRYGFEQCALHRIYACHFTRNPASGRVLQKIGMKYEGTLRHHLKKWDEYIDLAFYGILRDDEWRGVTAPGTAAGTAEKV